jgi:hypothetical protein
MSAARILSPDRNSVPSWGAPERPWLRSRADRAPGAAAAQGSENRKFEIAWLAKLGQPWFVGLPVA